MNKKIIQYIMGILAVLTMSSCEDYLDVQPMDKFLETQLFSTEVGVYNALNGIYLALHSNRAYGEDLTMGTVEALAQRYDQPSDRQPFYLYQTYNYDDGAVRSRFESIWTTAYVNILNVNALLEGLDTYPNVLSEENERLVRGECYALRAFLHFDMFRIFGPMPTSGFAQTTLPYYDAVEREANPLISGELFLEKVIKDLEAAESFLANDPVIEGGKLYSEDDNGGTNFFRYRNLRMNFYAAKALKARVYQYSGDHESALIEAEYVIENASSWFPWTNPSDVISTPEAPDRVFFSEILFGTYNLALYDRHRNLFSGELQETQVLYTRPARLETVFEGNESDYRYNSTWKLSGSYPFRTFYKYAEPGNINNVAPRFKYVVGLIRMSEMYYIAAEALADIDPAKSLEYLNTVRFNRGIQDFDLGVDINAEIRKEYQKEFYGEGQLFFYYKRRGISAIPNGSSNSGNKSMGASIYAVPLPLSELEFRN